MKGRQKVLEEAYAHSVMRLKTRYGIEISYKQWLKLSKEFKCKAVNLTKNHIGDYEGWIKINDIWVAVYYSSSWNCIKTFFSRPPDFNISNKENNIIKDYEEQLINRPKVSDIKWFKSKIHESRILINHGYIKDADILLDAISSIPTNKPVSGTEDIDKIITEMIMNRREQLINKL